MQTHMRKYASSLNGWRSCKHMFNKVNTLKMPALDICFVDQICPARCRQMVCLKPGTVKKEKKMYRQLLQTVDGSCCHQASR